MYGLERARSAVPASDCRGPRKRALEGRSTYLQRIFEHSVGVLAEVVEVLGFKDVVADEFALLRRSKRLLFRRVFSHASDRRLDRVGRVDGV